MTRPASMQQKRGHVKQPRFMKRESACSFTSKDDTSTTAGRTMFQMLGVFAEFERGIIRERVNAGLARAREKGTVLGRPPRPRRRSRSAYGASARREWAVMRLSRLVS